MKLNIYLSIFITLNLASCSISKPVNYSIEDSKNSLHPQFLIYHNNESTSQLFFQVATEDVLYSRATINQPFSAKILLEYIVFQKDHKEIIDSGSILITDQYLKNKKTRIDTNFIFNFSKTEEGFLDLRISDINRSREFRKTLSIDKFSESSRQFYMITDTNNQILFDDFFFEGQSILIKSNFNNDKLYATKNKTVFPLSPPPFTKSAQPSFPDNISFTEELNFNSQNIIFYDLPNEGFVFFQLDTLNDLGFTLFNFHNDYPLLKSAEQLIPPLRYLTTKDEFDLLVSSINPKVAVDKYWLSNATSKERARTLIRVYYSRVEFANKLFSCHLEGWKTDRGMISIIFGTPSYTSLVRNSEVWIYGDENNIHSLKFVFDQKPNPFSSNDFVLSRNYSYKNPWYRAVESWRNGKVYLLK
ncbi:MAG: GWxTD domain-containing protein [Flavobacteriales bacterium]|nr:GWxTD domain-containing protein [Flavobacteriales bacterium]